MSDKKIDDIENRFEELENITVNNTFVVEKITELKNIVIDYIADKKPTKR